MSDHITKVTKIVYVTGDGKEHDSLPSAKQWHALIDLQQALHIDHFDDIDDVTNAINSARIKVRAYLDACEALERWSLLTDEERAKA